MIAEGIISEKDIQTIWSEAPKKKIGKKEYIDFDTFKRLNVRLDMLLDELEGGPSNIETFVDSEDDTSADFYKREFSRISGGRKIVDLKDILDWVTTFIPF